MIAEGRALLEKALRHGPPGPYQIQAAIAAVHADAGNEKETDWKEIARLYQALYALDPSPVIRLNQAAAIANVEGPAAALEMIEPLSEELGAYRWYHAARAALLLDLGKNASAKRAFEEALHLGPTEPERRYLVARIAECEKKV